MQLTRINIVILLVFLILHSLKADLRRCADFNPELNFDEFPYQNEFEQFFNFFNESNPENTADLYQLLQRIESDEINTENYISSAKLLRYVVSQ